MIVTTNQPAPEPDTRHAARVHRDRAAALAGVVAGPLFLLTVVLLSWWQYDYLRSVGWTVLDAGDVPWPSGLALADHGWIQMLNFAVAGVLLFVFTRALPHQLPDRRSARIAAALMTVMAVALVASAAPTDEDFGADPSTWHGWTHGLAFVVLVLCSVVTPLVLARALRGVPGWRPFAPLSVAVAGLCVVSLAVPSQLGFYAFLVLVFGWFTALAARFYRLTGGPVEP